VKHAEATEIRVQLTWDDENVTVSVIDNGVGFESNKLFERKTKISGFGLFSIRERVAHFGGSMSFISQPGRETRVAITVPLKAEKSE
jgi:signal transduction histidine kinase